MAAADNTTLDHSTIGRQLAAAQGGLCREAADYLASDAVTKVIDKIASLNGAMAGPALQETSMVRNRLNDILTVVNDARSQAKNGADSLQAQARV